MNIDSITQGNNLDQGADKSDGIIIFHLSFVFKIKTEVICVFRHTFSRKVFNASHAMNSLASKTPAVSWNWIVVILHIINENMSVT